MKRIFMKIVILALLVSMLMLIISFNTVFAETPSAASGTTVWEKAKTVTDVMLNDVCYGKDMFVAVGDKGTIITSTDGVNWVLGKSGTTKELVLVAYGGGKYLAVGLDGVLLTSVDGLKWAENSFEGKDIPILDIIWDGKQFVFLGGTDIYTTVDGTAVKSSAMSEMMGESCGISKLDKTYVVVGSGEGADPAGMIANNYYIYVSDDGAANWTKYKNSTGLEFSNLFKVDNNGSLFAAVGADGIVYTSDLAGLGKGWTKKATGTTNGLYDVKWCSNRFVAVGSKGTIVSSADGITWTKNNSGSDMFLLGTAGNDSKAVAVGYKGTVLYSSIGTKSTNTDKGQIKININGKELALTHAPVLNGKTVLVPAEAVSKALGVQYKYDTKLKTMTLTKGKKVVKVKLDSSTATVDGKSVKLSAPAKLYKANYVSVQFLAETFGFTYKYDEKTSLIEIKGKV